MYIGKNNWETLLAYIMHVEQVNQKYMKESMLILELSPNLII